MKSKVLFCIGLTTLVMPIVAKKSAKVVVPPIVAAAQDGNLAEVRKLIAAKADVNAKAVGTSFFGDTALYWASTGFWNHPSNLDMLNELIKAGADVNAKSATNGDTALIGAASRDYKEQLLIIKKLIESGADVNAANKDGTTALMNAISFGLDRNIKIPIMQELIRAGANVNAVDKEGLSALMHATGRAEIDFIRELIKAGADVNAKNRKGKTALSHAKTIQGIVELPAAKAMWQEIIDLLQKSGAKNEGKGRF